MSAWQDTWAALFAEADAAKEAAKTAFLAGLVPPNPPVLPLAKVVPLADAMTTASWQALLKHIGPVSSDGSLDIGIQWTTDPVPVPQLDLTANTTNSQHRGIGPATIDAFGIVTLAPYHTSELTMLGGGTINGVKLYTSAGTALVRGDDHRLVVFGATHTAPVDVINGASVGAGNIAFCLPYSAGTDANARENFRFKASPAVFNLYIDPTVSVYLDGGKPSP
jgi:hypothetical protein